MTFLRVTITMIFLATIQKTNVGLQKVIANFDDYANII